MGFIDDIVYGVQGNTDKENTRKLKHILNEAEEWRKKHGAQFEISKYILIHYTRNRNDGDESVNHDQRGSQSSRQTKPNI